MTDHIKPTGGSSFHETSMNVGKAPGQKFSVEESHETTGGGAEGIASFVKKMFPSISEADAKKFINNLYNSLNLEIKKDIARAKETARRIKEDENG
jgi:hypothetical protein